MLFRNIVARNIYNLRMKHDMTLKEFGERIGKSAQYCSMMERGTLNFTAQIIDDVAKAFGVDVEEITRKGA